MSKTLKMELLKKNINFMDYPLFFSTKTRLTEWNDQEYTISCRHGLPGNRDINILNAIIHKSQVVKSPHMEFSTVWELLHQAGYGKRALTSQEVIESVTRWESTELTYLKFYSKGTELVKGFKSILSADYKQEDGLLTVQLNNQFYKANLDKYSKSVPLQMLNNMTPTAKRMTEILIKNFCHRQKWVVGYEKFLDKIPIMNSLSVKENIPQIKRYLKEINPQLKLYGFKNRFVVKFLPESQMILFFSFPNRYRRLGKRPKL